MIQQIVPATGWHAVFVERGDNGEAKLSTIPLCTWALVEHEDLGEEYRSIVGYGAWDVIDPVDDCSNFLGYVHETDQEGAEKYRGLGEDTLRRQEERERKHQRLLAAGFRYATSRGMPRWWSSQAGGWLTTKQALEQLESTGA